MEIDDDVLQTVAAHAQENESLRTLHPEVVAALIGSGLMRRLVATNYGGEAASIEDVLSSIEAVSRVDGSTGWCVMIANTTALTSFRLPAQWGEAIYSDPAACTGGFGMPAGTAKLVDGGLEVTGQWAWGSGTDHCTWIGGGVRVVDDNGDPAATADGAKVPFVFFEFADVELLDTWHVAGLKATASTDYKVVKAFIPEGRWAQLIGGRTVIESPLARFPFFGALAAGVSAVTIGLAERAIEELIKLGDKRSAGSSKSLSQRSVVQSDLALAVANVGQARSFLYEMVSRAADRTENADQVDDETRAMLRLAATAAAKRAVEAVDLCYHAAGGAAVYETSPLQRVFRDAHVATAHGMIAARTLEPLGRMKFGLETSAAFF